MVPGRKYLTNTVEPEWGGTGLKDRSRGVAFVPSRREMGQGRWKPRVETAGTGRRRCFSGLEAAGRVRLVHQ